MAVPQAANDRWSLDFISDALTDGRRFAGQAAALYELMTPGTMQQIARSGHFAGLSQFVTEAARAYADGRLRLTTDGWAQVPELTEDERRLAELPGCSC